MYLEWMDYGDKWNSVCVYNPSSGKEDLVAEINANYRKSIKNTHLELKPLSGHFYMVSKNLFDIKE